MEEGEADGLDAGEGGLSDPGAHVSPPVQRVVLQREEKGVVYVEDHLEAEAAAEPHHEAGEAVHGVPSRFRPLLGALGYFRTLNEGAKNVLFQSRQNAENMKRSVSGIYRTGK